MPRPQGAAVARTFTRSKLDGYDTELGDDVALVVSELVTNAYTALAAESDPDAPDLAELIPLTIERAPRWVHVRVTDTAPGRPCRSDAHSTSDHGRGLAIVDAVAALWWVHDLPTGKAVHAVLTVPGVVLTQDDADMLVGGL